MAAEHKLEVVLCWHMHQPEYRDLRTGAYQLPWTYLHAIKDYVDMAAHLEAAPGIKAVVNFAPILLEQIADYAEQIQGYLTNNVAIRDPLLAALVEPTFPASEDQRLKLVKDCLRANKARLIERFPPYQKLAELATLLCKRSDALGYVNNQFLADLIVWYHQAWLGESVRRGDTRIKRLTAKASGYTLHDRRELLTVIGELLSGIVARYQKLAERGQVELSLSPYAHPIVPLLLDIRSARDALPEIPLPLIEKYPGGDESAAWHVRAGIETFKKFFGLTPTGCWPSEGSVSTATLELLSRAGFQWAASGQNVLRNSLPASEPEQQADKAVHRAWRATPGGPVCFFRDDGLSDLIGFTYSDWHGDDAVANLIHNLENIADDCKQQPDAIVSIIMDGENAWEHYPENGYHFLTGLYERLADHPDLETTTYAEYLADQSREIADLPKLVSGSWVYGTFSTWIGDGDKNRAWDLLSDAKRSFDTAVAAGTMDDTHLALARKQLAVCEGSDWFWWFGDYNPAVTVSEFERLYRLHLANLYQMIGREPPAYLSEVFSHGSETPADEGVMRPGSAPE